MTVLSTRAVPVLDPKANAPLICFSHLRWDFVLQRPQHLMSRFARDHPVWFWEEPIPTDHHLPYLEFHAFDGTSVQAIRPRIPGHLPPTQTEATLTGLLNQFLKTTATHRPILWFYTPQMWPIARNVTASAIVFDCMDELSGFRFAPPDLCRNEAALIAAADVVFTGGYSLFEAKRSQHANIHPFPSSVDVAHFARARTPQPDPPDQALIARPRLGYYGVIDERLDLDLIAKIAVARPHWQIVMIGPIAKIDRAALPQGANLHWLGQKPYSELPAYLAGWDVALMPFAINEATRFISPTKTPEYLAGGRQVISTPVRDVVRHYGHMAAIHIARDSDGFVTACERVLNSDGPPTAWREEVAAMLADLSWDNTFARMNALVANAVEARGQTAREARMRSLVDGEQDGH